MITAASFPLGMMYPEFSNQNNDSYTGRISSLTQPMISAEYGNTGESKTLRIHLPYAYLPRKH
jgi:hypothetical protein